jgi:hypothetical protein
VATVVVEAGGASSTSVGSALWLAPSSNRHGHSMQQTASSRQQHRSRYTYTDSVVMVSSKRSPGLPTDHAFHLAICILFKPQMIGETSTLIALLRLSSSAVLRDKAIQHHNHPLTRRRHMQKGVISQLSYTEQRYATSSNSTPPLSLFLDPSSQHQQS